MVRLRFCRSTPISSTADGIDLSPPDLSYTSVAEQRQLLLNKLVTPRDLVGAALDRIQAVQPVLNCFVEIWNDEARSRAIELGHEPLTPETFIERPLWGIPVAIKDTTPWAGHRVTLGSATHRHHIAERTAYVVDALLAAGAIIVGSTNTPEFAHASITDNPLWGATRNPWNLARSPGGSSGGAGAAVASGCVAIAEGSDMGGSVRIPAAWCGVIGLKPSLGRIPMDSLPGLWDTLSHHGPLARSVDDIWEFLLATQGPSRRDPWSVLPALVRPVRNKLDATALRVGLSVDLGCWAVDPEIALTVEQAANEIARAGAQVERVDPGFSAQDELTWIAMWSVFMASYYGHLLNTHRYELDPDVVRLIEAGNRMSAADYKRLELRRSEVWRRIMAIFDHHDVIVCPTMAQAPKPATKVEERLRPAPAQDGRFHADDMTTVWNLVAPCPAISVPGGRFSTGVHEGLPIGVQIIGRPGRDDQVLELARIIESWSGSPQWRPPLG